MVREREREEREEGQVERTVALRGEFQCARAAQHRVVDNARRFRDPPALPALRRGGESGEDRVVVVVVVVGDCVVVVGGGGGGGLL